MIVCKNLGKTFPGGAGINGINLEFRPGIIYGITGGNGAGKTTLLRCIAGLYLPGAGAVVHDGIDTRDESRFRLRRGNIAFLPGDDYLYPRLTCRENIELVNISRTGKKKMPQETEKLLAWFEADSFMDRRFKDCSTGMKKKIQIIAGLIGDINTIVWDEPNDGLDLLSNLKIKELLHHYKNRNAVILVSCHVLEFLAGLADSCVVLKDGTVAEARELDGTVSLEELYLRHIDRAALRFPLDSEP